MTTNLLVVRLRLQNILPYLLLFVGNRSQNRLDEVLSRLNPKKGENSPLGLNPQGFFFCVRV
jgi:hypothetical protein